MATAAQVIDAALKNILVQGASTSPDPDMYQDAIFSMNNFMFDLDGNGYRLGYTEITSVSDAVTIPTGALRGLIMNLAIDIAPQYNGTVTPALADAARNSLATMKQLGITIGSSKYPSTLPYGSGNYDNSTNSRLFYPCSEEEILAETTGAIALETGTQEAVNGN